MPSKRNQVLPAPANELRSQEPAKLISQQDNIETPRIGDEKEPLQLGSMT